MIVGLLILILVVSLINLAQMNVVWDDVTSLRELIDRLIKELETKKKRNEK